MCARAPTHSEPPIGPVFKTWGMCDPSKWGLGRVALSGPPATAHWTALQSGCLRNSGLYMTKGLGAFRPWILGIISSEVSRPHFWKRNWLKHHGLGVTSWKLSQAPLVLVLALCSLCLGLFSSSSSVCMYVPGWVCEQ